MRQPAGAIPGGGRDLRVVPSGPSPSAGPAPAILTGPRGTVLTSGIL